MPQSVDSNSFYHKRFSIPAISLLLSSTPRNRRFVSEDPNPGYALICDFAHVKITLDLIFGFNKTEFVSIAVVSVGKNLPLYRGMPTMTQGRAEMKMDCMMFAPLRSKSKTEKA